MLEVDIRLTIDDLNIILLGLGKLPLENSVIVWGKLKQAGELALDAARKADLPSTPEKGKAD